MEIISDPQEMQGRARQWRAHGLKVVLVPTMGFFHRGHLSLMEYGRTIGERLVVVVAEEYVADVLLRLQGLNEQGYVIGEIVERTNDDPPLVYI